MALAGETACPTTNTGAYSTGRQASVRRGLGACPTALKWAYMRRSLALIALGLGLILGSAFAQPVPRPSPEFVINMPNGSQLLLSQYTGKVVVLAFLFTT